MNAAIGAADLHGARALLVAAMCSCTLSSSVSTSLILSYVMPTDDARHPAAREVDGARSADEPVAVGVCRVLGVHRHAVADIDADVARRGRYCDSLFPTFASLALIVNLRPFARVVVTTTSSNFDEPSS